MRATKQEMTRRPRLKIVYMLEATLGGIRKHVVDLALGLNKNLYEVSLVYSTQRADETFRDNIGTLRRSGIRLYELPMTREVNLFYDLACLARLVKFLLKEKPDIIHLHGAKAGALGRMAVILTLCHSKVVYTPHGGSFHLFDKRFGRIYKSIETILSRRRFHYVGVSQDSCNKISGIVKNQKNVHLIFNGIEHTVTRRVSKAQSLKRSKKELAVLYPALLMENKGHLEFLEALNTSRGQLSENVRIFLAGDGPLTERIQRKIAEYRLDSTVVCLGFVKDLLPLYEQCDLVMLPSRSEVFGYVLLEAMSHAKPILATRNDAIPEIIVEGVNGELFESDRLHYMVERIGYYEQNRRELRRLGKKSYSLFKKRFTLEDMIRGTDRLYRSILQEA